MKIGRVTLSRYKLPVESDTCLNGDLTRPADITACFAHIINLVVQKFIRAVIVTPSDDDEGNTDTGNGDDFTLDIGDDDLAFGGIISKL